MDCLGLFSTKNVKVNEVITFNHSAEIEVIILNYCDQDYFIICICCSIWAQTRDVVVEPSTARRSWGDTPMLEVWSSAELVRRRFLMLESVKRFSFIPSSPLQCVRSVLMLSVRSTGQRVLASVSGAAAGRPLLRWSSVLHVLNISVNNV